MNTSSFLSTRFTRAPIAKPAAFLLALAALAFTSGNLDAQRQEVPILLYGPVANQAEGEFWVSTGQFEAQMQQLDDRGYTTISLQQYVDHIANPSGTSLPSKPIILTFINGYDNHRTNVDPVLADHGFTATAFLVSDFIGGDSSWDEGDDGSVLPHLTWDAVRNLQSSGRWEIGSHTRTHERLTELTGAQRESQIAGSKDDIENEINGEVLYFSYPFGAGTDNGDIRSRVQNAGYTAAVGVHSEAGETDPTSHNDPFALPRFYVKRDVTIQEMFGPDWLNDTSGGGDFVAHPADSNADGEIGSIELTGYASAWLNGDHNEATLLTRAAQIWLAGGFYDYNANESGANRWTAQD